MVVFVDEIEKAFAGTGTDLSGVKTEMTGTMLSWMQDREADGVVLIGPAGTAKSAIAKATGNTAGIPTIAFDFGAMQNSLVGASGERLRAALQVVDTVSRAKPVDRDLQFHRRAPSRTAPPIYARDILLRLRHPRPLQRRKTISGC